MIAHDPIVITGAKRTAIGHFNGLFKSVSTTELGAAAIHGAIEQAQVKNDNIDTVIMGCVLTAGLGQAPARQAAIQASLHTHTPCTTVNKMCGSGLATIIEGIESLIADPHKKNIIAGGMENMSRSPFLLPNARFGYRIGTHEVIDHMMKDGLEDAFENKSMGHYAEQCAQKYHFDRNAQDAYAINSGLRAIKANELGIFKNEITPVKTTIKGVHTSVIEDEGLSRFDADKIATLKPAFKKNGTVTAANASSISDGAAAVVLTRESLAKKNNQDVLAKICGYHTIAQSPEWFTTAPIQAIKQLLQKIKWSIDDVDLFEINEAFALVPLVTITELAIPPVKVNIYGGACILGHPIGASGARILVTLINALQQKNLKRGIAAICIGGGEAIALAIEI